jgi:hypothetical protein
VPVFCESNNQSPSGADFAAKFRSADPQVRRHMVIDAIDSNLIRVGMGKSYIERMFEGNFVCIAEKEDYSKYVALFEPIIPPDKPLMSPIVRGWYVCFRFDKDGVLEDIFISKRHPYWGHLM